MDLLREYRAIAGPPDPAELLHDGCCKPDLVAGDGAPPLGFLDLLKSPPNGVSLVEVCRIKLCRQYFDMLASAKQFDYALGLFPHVKFDHLYSPRSFLTRRDGVTESYRSPCAFAMNPLGRAVRGSRSFRWRSWRGWSPI